ncbi:hypothetical protein F7661_08985 [Pseudomonas sp. CFA]|nr:hypothetical protein F7661_08985 [Pseudomonas sp. CFA]
MFGACPTTRQRTTKTALKAAPELVGSTDQRVISGQSNPFALYPRFGGRPQVSRFVGRALNKNKKPSKKTIRARNDFLGSLGSPCRFYPSGRHPATRLHHSPSKC